MIPNMFKIAGELTSTVFNVAARSVACQALSIFGEHSDVMATRSTGFALLASNSIQEAMDFPLIAQAATLESRVPFLHFFDGFRTSHEISKVELLAPEDMKPLIDDDLIRAHRKRALSPDSPVIRGTAQNPDVYFQARETVNPYYLDCPDIVQKVMEKFEKVVGRKYELFQYFGAPDAERKEPGSIGEPLYADIVTAIYEGMTEGITPFKKIPKIIGGRYGLSSKEFTPAMVKGIFEEMKKEVPKNHFTIRDR
jgi:pyruvate-ferredoxin/flavodoxin oxidoreductase